MKKFLLACGIGVSSWVQAQPTELILMRHLHKATGDNPPLSACGVAQAAALRAHVMSQQVVKAWHTQYNRSQETAQRLVNAVTVLKRYDAKQAADTFKRQLEQEQGLQLIVGHSNTIPALLASFGVASDAIKESEYGTLYRLRWQGEQWVLYREPLLQTLPPCQSSALQ